MAKGKITHRSVENGLERQSQTDLTIDTAPLPPAEELEKYQRLNPDIIRFLLDAAEKEQANRHWAEKEKIKIVSRSEKRTTQINVTGMVFAFFCDRRNFFGLCIRTLFRQNMVCRNYGNIGRCNYCGFFHSAAQ